jgi:hypothetical protein
LKVIGIQHPFNIARTLYLGNQVFMTMTQDHHNAVHSSIGQFGYLVNHKRSALPGQQGLKFTHSSGFSGGKEYGYSFWHH